MPILKGRVGYTAKYTITLAEIADIVFDRLERLENFKVIFLKLYCPYYCIIKIATFSNRLLNTNYTIAFFIFYKSRSILIQIYFIILRKRRRS